MKPDWRKGDVIAMPACLSQKGAIYDGCWVGIAEHDPREEYGRWLYAQRDCRELRRATVADIDRLIATTQRRLQQEERRISELLNLRRMVQ